MNSKATKRSLFASVIALMLCFSMLLGTTFAWFTDTVTSANNIIKSGNLDVEMYWADGKAEPDAATTSWADASTDKIFDYDKWEPGYVEVRHIKIKNAGSLALKYKVAIEAEGEVSELADVIDVYYKDPAVQVAERTDVTKLEKLGTLTQVLAKLGETGNGELPAGTADTITLAFKMQETAGNEYQNKQIGTDFSVKLFATQLASELDSFDATYDENAGLPWDGSSKETPVADANGVYHVTTPEQLVAMMDKTGNSIYIGETILLEADINLGGYTVKGFGGGSNFAGIFDGQGHTISNFKVVATDREYYAGLFNQVSHGGTIKNLTVSGATVIGTKMVGAVASSVDANAVVDNCKAINCTLIGVKRVGAVVGYSSNSTVTNNYAKDCKVFYSDDFGGEVLGFENTGSTVNNNSSNNVVVKNTTVNVVSNASELKALSAKALTGNNGKAEEATVIFGADINMDGAEFSSIIAQRGDKLTIIGNGHTISNVKVVSGDEDNTTGQAGMFYAFPNSTLEVSDLTLKNITVTADANDSGYAAALIGYCEGKAILNNVDVVNATVTGAKSSGLMVGHLTPNGSVEAKDCELSGSVTLSDYEAGGHYAGKYIGTLGGPVKASNCTVNATVSGNIKTSNVGDIYGRILTTGSWN